MKGMPFFGALLRHLARNKLSVFLFHKVPQVADTLTPEDVDIEHFNRLLDFIEEHFEVLPFETATSRLAHGRLPHGAACITFDDGYPDWLNGVARLLAARNLPATFFLTTCQFEGRPMWHERIANAIRHFPGDALSLAPVRLPSIPVATLAEKRQALKRLEHHFKYAPPVLREHYLEYIEGLAGTALDSVPRMPAEDVRQLAAMGFEIGAHTHEHPILSLCETATAIDEIARCKEILESLGKTPVRSFAYPNGRPHVDFAFPHIRMIKAAGYAQAVTTQWGAARQETSVFQIPRFTPWGPGALYSSLQVIRNLAVLPEYIEEPA